MIPENKSGPPLGGAPGYGDATEGVVGNQGNATSPGGGEAKEKPKAEPTGAKQQSEQGGGEGKGDTVVLKEELPPEEKGTSLDEGGAG